jgi:hypothetical protein
LLPPAEGFNVDLPNGDMEIRSRLRTNAQSIRSKSRSATAANSATRAGKNGHEAEEFTNQLVENLGFRAFASISSD